MDLLASLVPSHLQLNWVATCGVVGAMLLELAARIAREFGTRWDLDRAWRTGMFWGALLGFFWLLWQEVR
jgi:hypothetical protein